MSIYRKRPGGETVIVCDGCGIAQDGVRPDMATLVKADLGAEMRNVGFPVGTDLDVKDWCPDCLAKKGTEEGEAA